MQDYFDMLGWTSPGLLNTGRASEKGSDQLIETLYTLSIYPAVHKQLILTLFEGRLVSDYKSWLRKYKLRYTTF